MTFTVSPEIANGLGKASAFSFEQNEGEKKEKNSNEADKLRRVRCFVLSPCRNVQANTKGLGVSCVCVKGFS